MRDFVNLNCVLVLLLCAVSLPISIYPGGLQRLFMSLELALFVVFVVAPSWFLWLVALCARPLWQKRNPFASVPWRRVMATFGLLCLVYGMLKFYIPRRVVFPIHRSVFAGCVARAPSRIVARLSGVDLVCTTSMRSPRIRGVGCTFAPGRHQIGSISNLGALLTSLTT